MRQSTVAALCFHTWKETMPWGISWGGQNLDKKKWIKVQRQITDSTQGQPNILLSLTLLYIYDNIPKTGTPAPLHPRRKIFSIRERRAPNFGFHCISRKESCPIGLIMDPLKGGLWSWERRLLSASSNTMSFDLLTNVLQVSRSEVHNSNIMHDFTLKRSW